MLPPDGKYRGKASRHVFSGFHFFRIISSSQKGHQRAHEVTAYCFPWDPMGAEDSCGLDRRPWHAIRSESWEDSEISVLERTKNEGPTHQWRTFNLDLPSLCSSSHCLAVSMVLLIYCCCPKCPNLSYTHSGSKRSEEISRFRDVARKQTCFIIFLKMIGVGPVPIRRFFFFSSASLAETHLG